MVCCDRRHLDKSTSDYIRRTGTRGGRISVTLVTSTPQQMYVILLIYQNLYISELQIFSRLSMHNIKITAAPQPTHSKPSAIFKLLWRQPNLASQVMSRGLSGWSGRYNSYVLRCNTKFVVQRCIGCCDRRQLDKSTSDYIRNTGTRGRRIFVTLVTSTPQQMYAILLIYQYIHERLHLQYRYPWWTYFRDFCDFNAPTDVCNPANLPISIHQWTTNLL